MGKQMAKGTIVAGGSVIGASSLIWPQYSMRQSLISLNQSVTPTKNIITSGVLPENSQRNVQENVTPSIVHQNEKVHGNNQHNESFVHNNSSNNLQRQRGNTYLSLQDKSIGSNNRLQFNFQDLTHGDLISGVFDNLYRENEEFLVAFDLCRDDL